MAGIRTIDLPDLGAVVDAASFVGDYSGTGRFTGPALKAYLASWTVVHVAGDGVTNDTPALAAAFAALGAGGGTVVIPNGKLCLIDTALTIPANVRLLGPLGYAGAAGAPAAPYASRSCLIVNPAVSITLSAGAGIEGCLIYRKGMTFPAADASAFAGTAVIGANDDTYLRSCMLLGFNQAYICTGHGRSRIECCNIDCQNGIDISGALDIPYLFQVHCWPFATVNGGGGNPGLQRSGVGFYLHGTDSDIRVYGCFAYGYATGFRFTDIGNGILEACTVDNTGVHTSSVGFLIDGATDEARLIGCTTTGCDQAATVNVTGNRHVSFVDFLSGGNTVHGITVLAGDVTVIGGTGYVQPDAVTINNTTSKVFIDGLRTSGLSATPIVISGNTTLVKLGSGCDFGDLAAGASPFGGAGTKAIPSVASADPLLLPPSFDQFQITGTTNFGNITGGYAGRTVTLHFSGALSVFHSTATTNSMRLTGSLGMSTGAGSTLSLRHNGVQWYEVGRCV